MIPDDHVAASAFARELDELGALGPLVGALETPEKGASARLLLRLAALHPRALERLTLPAWLRSTVWVRAKRAHRVV
eukprot:2701522-Prymnesium_polylepis.1